MIQGSGMVKHSLQRLLGLIPTLLMLITLAFFLIRVAPGGPFDAEKTLPPEIEANLNAKYHLALGGLAAGLHIGDPQSYRTARMGEPSSQPIVGTPGRSWISKFAKIG